LTFSVLGLGDSSYPLFNAIARRLHQRLIDLGAHPLLDRYLADDQSLNGIDDCLNSYLPALWSAADQHFPLPQGVTAISEQDRGREEAKYHVEIVREEKEEKEDITMTDVHHSSPSTSSAATSSSSSAAAIVSAAVTLP